MENSSSIIISGLLSSFARALDHFFPLASRLVMVKNEGTISLSIFLNCNDKAIEFIHAFAANVVVLNILAPLYILSDSYAFFLLNGMLGCDNHSKPLLIIRVIKLIDDHIFIDSSP
ncbi:uncharacterized acetyltransferase At3g50280-like [Elaeis guineensis]|uniref:uncharacterized acetyltransferase At3g50280-like n=1 Tax=Elaeis guineensis var. tenera TaxID=51953 RepID=UPI003C6D45DD